jgi:hypothetical protein
MGQGELEGCARAAVGSPVFPNLRCSDDVPTVDPDRADAGRWYTSKPCFPAIKSHISHLVGDSAWEGHAANVFEGRDEVTDLPFSWKSVHWTDFFSLEPLFARSEPNRNGVLQAQNHSSGN